MNPTRRFARRGFIARPLAGRKHQPKMSKTETNLSPATYSMRFDGTVLNRGFWLYVWRVTCRGSDYLYVGRTGDSSSANASSPFLRIGQHLDFRASAKGNSLSKHLATLDIKPAECTFEMLAIGPLFPEEKTMDLHRPVRDRVAALEKKLALFLRECGYKVMGTHGASAAVEPELWGRVIAAVSKHFPRPNV